MKSQQYDIGMVGLGVMGRNLLVNMAGHGFSVAGYDQDLSKVDALREESKQRNSHGAEDTEEFTRMLRPPRAVILLVPAAAPVDSVIRDLMPRLEPGDLIIDAGNSYFKDTDVRARNLAKKSLQFLGVGISGGEEGARHGPSIMPGGHKEAYERVRPIFFCRVDEKTGNRLIDVILDVARHKGTGMWTSQAAMELQVPIPTIDTAIAMRNLSVFESERGCSKTFARPIGGSPASTTCSSMQPSRES